MNHKEQTLYDLRKHLGRHFDKLVIHDERNAKVLRDLYQDIDRCLKIAYSKGHNEGYIDDWDLMNND